METLFEGGRVVELILLLMLAEAAVLAFLRARRGLGPGVLPLLPNLLAGAFLLLALRAALRSDDVPLIAGWLLLGLFAHLADLAIRWRGTSMSRRP
jgi:hypothetical protein